MVVGVLLLAAYSRYRTRRLERLAESLGLSANQIVVWRRWSPGRADSINRLVVHAMLVAAIATGIVVGAATNNLAIALQASLVPIAITAGVAMVMDIRWLLRLHPTVEDIEPLDPPSSPEERSRRCSASPTATHDDSSAPSTANPP